MLERVGATPLKASQKMEILRFHVLPTGIHPLVLGGRGQTGVKNPLVIAYVRMYPLAFATISLRATKFET